MLFIDRAFIPNPGKQTFYGSAKNIAVAHFATTVNSMAGKLSQKLNWQRLEFTGEQVPQAFAIVDKGGAVREG